MRKKKHRRPEAGDHELADLPLRGTGVRPVVVPSEVTAAEDQGGERRPRRTLSDLTLASRQDLRGPEELGEPEEYAPEELGEPEDYAPEELGEPEDYAPEEEIGEWTQEEPGPSGPEPAPLGDRLLGGLADLAIHFGVLALMVVAVYLMGIRVTVADAMPFAVLLLVFSFLYWFIPLAFWGQTPGMAWVGHTAESLGGEPLSFGQTTRRWIGALVTLALAGLPLLLALGGRSLTDRLSDSRTVVP